MSGHSRWAQIKHKKAGSDAKRGALFSKLSRLITVAARDGGGDPKANAKLRNATEQARSAGIPRENIERAIARGVGGSEEAALREVEYEAYGQSGSAYLIAGVTDNANRTTNEIKHILMEHGGRLAQMGSVAWLFERRIAADFALPEERRDEVELVLIDAGAEDTVVLKDRFRAIVEPERWENFREALDARGFRPLEWSTVALAKNPIALTGERFAAVVRLREALEDHSDVNDVWTNVNEP